MTEQQEAWESRLAQASGSLCCSSSSPERTPIDPAGFFQGKSLFYTLRFICRILPKIIKSGRGITDSFTTLTDNPESPRTRASDTFVSHLQQYCHSLGADMLGYTTVEPHHIFRGLAVLYPHVIVLIKEMDAEKLQQAPSFATSEMIHDTYAELGEIANRVAGFLRENGFGAQAGPALGGSTIYPVLAYEAGLGAIGAHGLLITPRFGSRQRIAVVYTSIENLPRTETNQYEWIRDYCRTCAHCINVCPGNAIYRYPQKGPGATVTHMDRERCLPYFYRLYGCSWCIKECPFNSIEYESLKKHYHELKESRMF
jgi:NAD-dependent dihydropyrimidine dehydrogenase PreA subunit